MGDDDEGDAFFLIKIEKKFFNFGASGRIEVASGFVGKDDFGMIDDGASDADALLLPARKIVGFVVGFVVKLNGLEGGHGELFAVAAVGAGDFERQEEVVEDGVAGVHEELLKDEAEIAIADFVELAGFEPGTVGAVDLDAATGGLVEQGEQVHESGFARAGFAEDGDCLAGVDF